MNVVPFFVRLLKGLVVSKNAQKIVVVIQLNILLGLSEKNLKRNLWRKKKGTY